MMLTATFLGTGAAVPSLARNVSALMVQREGERLLFDCGEGTQRQMMRYGAGFGLNEIFFTHYHSDHLLGLTGLVRTMGMQDRTDPLLLYGPKGAKRILGAALSLGIERTKFPVELIELRPGDILGRSDYDLVVFPTEHRADTVGFALIEHRRLGRFDPEVARARGVPEGPAWGRLHRGESVTLEDGTTVSSEDLVGAPRPGRKLVYTGDTRPTNDVVTASQGADLLIHDATFGEDEADRAEATGHSTAREAAEVALEAGVKRLALTHISARYTREAPELLAEATAVFPDSLVAYDGLEFEIPLAEASDGSPESPAPGASAPGSP